MQEKRIKTFDEWKDIVGKLSPQDFEHLCYQLVRSMPGFYNVYLRDGSFDSGRDIDAKYRSKIPDGITEINEKWRFECKKYSAGISFEVVSGKIQDANLNRIDKLVIMSNMHLTPACKDQIENIQNNVYCKIIDWTGVRFQEILFQFPHICDEFFPEEDIPKRSLNKKQPQELIDISQKAGSHFGINLKIGLKDGQKPPTDIYEAADLIKQNLLSLEPMDLNIKSLIYQQMCRLFLSINRKEDALFFAEESLKITPNNIAVLLNKGLILEKLDKLDKSNKCYDKVINIDKNNKFALNNKAHNLRRAGDLEIALIFVEEALNIDKGFVSAINNKVSILIDLNRSESALEYLKPILAEHNKSRILLLSKVNILIDLLDLKEAMKINDKVLELDPTDIDAINSKGVIFEHNSMYQNKEKYLNMAIEWFEKTIDRDAKYPFGWSNKIVCLINNNSVSSAEELLESISGQFPDDAYLLREKGRILMRKKDPKNALKYFQKSLKKHSMRKTVINKCWALYFLNKHTKVIYETNNILKYDERNCDAWQLKGLALKKTHQIVKAEHCFEKAREYEKVPISLLE